MPLRNWSIISFPVGIFLILSIFLIKKIALFRKTVKDYFLTYRHAVGSLQRDRSKGESLPGDEAFIGYRSGRPGGGGLCTAVHGTHLFEDGETVYQSQSRKTAQRAPVNVW